MDCSFVKYGTCIFPRKGVHGIGNVYRAVRVRNYYNKKHRETTVCSTIFVPIFWCFLCMRSYDNLTIGKVYHTGKYHIHLILITVLCNQYCGKTLDDYTPT